MGAPTLTRETLDRAWRANRQGVLRLADWLRQHGPVEGRGVVAVCRALGIPEQPEGERFPKRNLERRW